MASKFGKRVGSAKNLKQQVKRSKGSGLAYIPKDGSVTVRFLTEPENWYSFEEVWDTELKKGYPLPADPSMPGGDIDPESRKSTRWVAPVLLVEENKVAVMQMAKTLVSTLEMYYEKFSTIMDRDYDLIRSGSGMETEYGAIVDAPSPRKLKALEIPDLDDALEKAYLAVWGDQVDEEEEDAPKSKKTPGAKSAASKRASKLVEEDDDDDDEDEDEEIEEEDDEEEEEDDEDEEEEEGYSEDDLKGMSLKALKELAEEVGIDPVPKGKANIIEAILELNEEEDEDDDDDEDEEDEDEGDTWTEDELNELSLVELKSVATEYGLDVKRLKKKDAIVEAILALGDED